MNTERLTNGVCVTLQLHFPDHCSTLSSRHKHTKPKGDSMKIGLSGFIVGVILVTAGISSANNVVVNGDLTLTAPDSGIVFPGGVKQTEAVTPDSYQKRITAPCNTGFAVTAIDASGNVTCTPTNPGWVIFDSDLLSNVKGNVGIHSTLPTSPLTVAGTIETTSGGVKFPDGTLQTTAAVTTPPGDCHGGRYEDNGDETVSDCRTGLIWLKNANCAGVMNWAAAGAWAAALANGACGLSDGSSAGDWRLPTKTEWMAMVAYAKGRYSMPILTNAAGTAKWTEGDPFLNVRFNSSYWSGSEVIGNTTNVWYVPMFFGNMDSLGKSISFYVWPVRSGQ
jgi:hypothetical protein